MKQKSKMDFCKKTKNAKKRQRNAVELKNNRLKSIKMLFRQFTKFWSESLKIKYFGNK